MIVITPDEMRTLVRRDLWLTLGGSVFAIWTYALVAAGHYGFISRTTAATVDVAVAVMVVALCLWWWAAGPRSLLRHRVMVLVPAFLIAGPGILGLHDLGAGVVAVMLSGAVGISAAVAFGLVYATRRRT